MSHFSRAKLRAALADFWQRQTKRTAARQEKARQYSGEELPIHRPASREAEAIPEYPRTAHQHTDIREAR